MPRGSSESDPAPHGVTLRLYLALFSAMGLRKGELCDLRWKDVQEFMRKGE